jgi:hypothetical protein
MGTTQYIHNIKVDKCSIKKSTEIVVNVRVGLLKMWFQVAASVRLHREKDDVFHILYCFEQYTVINGPAFRSSKGAKSWDCKAKWREGQKRVQIGEQIV